MTAPLRVLLEQGKKKAVVVALDWPGWNRGAKTEEQALAVHAAYRARYAGVAALAGLGDELAATGATEIVERTAGAGMTDFYTLSYRSATCEHDPMADAECERRIALLRACWTYFDAVAARVSAELQKGPRGGGRDRDTIVRHTNAVEIADFARKLGVVADEDAWKRPEDLRAYRDDYCDAIREHAARGASARTWTLRFLIRHSAYHMLDHAWEMEDKDLSRTSGRSG
jgi:hypothetical protein